MIVIEGSPVILEALDEAARALSPFAPGAVDAEHESGSGGPVVEADRAVDRVLRGVLLHNGDVWFSEGIKVSSIIDNRLLTARDQC